MITKKAIIAFVVLAVQAQTVKYLWKVDWFVGCISNNGEEVAPLEQQLIMLAEQNQDNQELQQSIAQLAALLDKDPTRKNLRAANKEPHGEPYPSSEGARNNASATPGSNSKAMSAADENGVLLGSTNDLKYTSKRPKNVSKRIQESEKHLGIEAAMQGENSSLTSTSNNQNDDDNALSKPPTSNAPNGKIDQSMESSPAPTAQTESDPPPTTQTESPTTNHSNIISNKTFVIHKMEKKKTPVIAEVATKDDPFVAETQYKAAQWKIYKLFFGPGKPYFPEGVGRDETMLIFPNGNSTDAICRIRVKADMKLQTTRETIHYTLPHNFQQLLQCFSWWQIEQNQKKQPVLQIEDYELLNATSLGRESIHTYYKAMKEVFGVRLDITNTTHTHHSTTGSYVVVDVPWPKMETQLHTYKVQHPEHAKTLVNGILDHYTPNNPNRAGCVNPKGENRTKPVIAFLDRQDSRRRLQNHEEILEKLKLAGYNDVVYKPSFNDSPLVDQMKFMSEVDILMGPHGAQFTNVLYQPECGSLFEFFPPGYLAPNFFGSLAAMRGNHHFLTYNGGKVQLQKNRDVIEFNVSASAVLQVMPLLIDKWHSCCASKHQP